MLSISIYNQKLKLINKCLFGKEYDSDKNTKLDKIKQFQEVLTKFVQDHKETVSVNDIKQFINGKKQNLSEIGVEDPKGKLLAVLLPIYKNNNLNSVQDFLSLISDFDIQDVKIVFHIKYNIYRCYVCSQNCTEDVFKKTVNDLLSCNFLDMQTFKNFIDQCFSQDKNKKLIKKDCFNYVFGLLKERFNKEKIKNINKVEWLPNMIICRFGVDVLKNADESIFQYMLNLTKDASTWNSKSKNFYNWFEVFSSFKAEFWDKVDLKDKCWIVQYTSFLMITLNFLSDNSSKRKKFYLYDCLNSQDILDETKESYKTAVLDFIKNEYILPETKLMIMLFCAELYITDTQFLREILGSNGVNEFFSIHKKVKLDASYLPDTVVDCLSVYSTQEISDFIKKYNDNDIKQNDSSKLKSIWSSVMKRCKDERSKTKITDFFATPKDLLNFYKKTYPKFLETDVSKLERSDILGGDYQDLYDCLKKYSNKEIADFIGKSDEPLESLFIWHVIHERCEDKKLQTKITDFFATPKDLFNFYKKTHPKFLETDVSKLEREDILGGDYQDLYDCLKKYNDKEIADFIGKSNEAHESLFVWHVIHERCEDKKLQIKITDFFLTPKDLFDFYKKVHPKFLETDVSKLERQDIVYGDHKSLYDCLQKYSNEEIVDFIGKSDEPHESLFIWTLLTGDSRNAKNAKNEDQFSFQEPGCFIDFYINKVPNEAKNSSDFNIFLYMSSMCNNQKLWQNYFESISQQKSEHIQLFRDFFDGKIDFSGMNNWVAIVVKHFFKYNKYKKIEYDENTNFRDIDNWIRQTMRYSILSNFTDLKSFLDFYIAIYSNSNSNKDLLEQKASKQKTILVAMIENCKWNLTDSLLKMCDKKYDFFVSILIDKIANEFYRLSLSDLAHVVQFLSKKNDIDQELKGKLLKIIDDGVVGTIKSLDVEYYQKSYDDHRYPHDAFVYPKNFETDLAFVIEIMNSDEVLPATKKTICDWAKKDLEKDQKQWEYVLEMYVYNIEKDKKPKKPIDLSEPSLFPTGLLLPLLNFMEQQLNNGNQNDENNKYERLQYYSIDKYKDLTTLNSHQGEWHLADLKNSNKLKRLESQIKTNENQIETLGNQIVALNNNLAATEFKLELSWNLFIWLSLIGTIIRVVQRYLWNGDLLEARDQKALLETENKNLTPQKQDLENKVKLSCENKKADYEDSLSKAKEAMKKWGKCENSTDYPYDKHEKYCAGLKQIIDIYEQQRTQVYSKESNGLIPPQEEKILSI